MIHNLRSRALAVLLLLVLAIGLIPTVAMAANTATVQINGQTLLDGVPVQCGEGTAVLDEESGTLTLNNATIEQGNVGVPVLRVDNGELKIVLIGENAILSTSQRPIYVGSVDLTIQGSSNKDLLTIATTASTGLQIENGNLTIDGCSINAKAEASGGIMCYAINNGNGIVTIKNGADINIECDSNALVGDKGLFIIDSTVNVITTGSGWNAICGQGDFSIENSYIEATTVSKSAGPAVATPGNIDIDRSYIAVNSGGSIGIYSANGFVKIQDSVATVTVPSNLDAIRGKVGGTTISGSWIEAFGSEVSSEFTSSDSVIFLNNKGEANGSLSLPGSVTVAKDMKLSIPVNSSVTVPKGVTFTNHGTINVVGSIVKDGGDIVCDNHTGGVATCTALAYCSICGNEYGDLVSHNLTKTETQAATCTEEGNTEYWYCETCKKYFSDSEGKNEIAPESTVIPAIGHSYENGKCTVCGAIDPNFTPEIIAGANGTWQKGTQDGLSFTSNAAFDDFIKVQVDGKDLDASNYTTKEGSTIVTLKASYLETLSVGKHTLAIVSDTGTAETEFTILAASDSDESLVQTGDNNMSLVALLSIIGVMSAVIGVVALRKSRL